MQELERMIKIYHTAYVACLVLAVVFLALTVFLFFKFDIRKIIDMKTGRGAKRSIQKMEELNSRTGKLRQDMTARTPSQLKAEDRIAYPKTEKNLEVHAQHSDIMYNSTEMQRRETTILNDSSETTVLSDSSQTTILSNSSETTILYQQDPGTTVLSNNPLVEMQPESKKLPGTFKIEKEILWIDTKEVL